MSYQSTTLVGHLGRDPELRYTGSGDAVCSFSLAVNSGFGDNEVTSWWRISVWKKLAEVCKQYLEKGRQVLVVGELKPDPETGDPKIWQGNDGTPRASYELTAFKVEFLGNKGESSQGNAKPASEEPMPF